MVRNLGRLSKKLGIGFNFPYDRFPVNSLKALRGSYFARSASAEREDAYIRRVFESCWNLNEDISDPAKLRAIAENVFGADSEQFFLYIESDEAKQKLRADTQRAFERGVFGSPTVFIDGELYWGSPEIFWYLQSELE
jgi:2-hydroxychromene-2-carboxylate isomerase